MRTLPSALQNKIAQRRAVHRNANVGQPFTGRQAAENPAAVMQRLCAWARLLGPLAAERGIRPDLTLQTTSYTPPRLRFTKKGGTINRKTTTEGWKLFAVVDDPAGNSPPVIHPEELLPRDRGVLLTPQGELILVKGSWGAGTHNLDVTAADVNYGDGMGKSHTLTLEPGLATVPRALELLGGLAAVEGGLVHFATVNDLDR